MPISENEAKRLIEHIETTVRDVAGDSRGITGLIDQWKADVEAGRSIERKLPVRRSPDHDGLIGVPRSRSATSSEFVGKEDYTNVEQLDMLVVSLSLAFLAPSMMSKRLLDTIAKYSGDQELEENPDPVIGFVGVATTDASRPSPRISQETIAQSSESTARLATLLNEIIREAELTPRRLVDGEDTV